MKAVLTVLTLLLLSPTAHSANILCGTADEQTQFTEANASPEAALNAVMARCLSDSINPESCQKPSCALELVAATGNKKCDSDRDCQGFANRCFAGRCTQPGFGCASDKDCPGFANRCFAQKCTRQEPLCNSDKDCHGFANRCFAGKCTNP